MESNSGIVEDHSDLMSWAMSDEFGKNPHVAESTKYVEITKLPKKIEPKPLTAMIMTSSKILPKKTEICTKLDTMERVALVEFGSVVDAYQAVDRLRTSLYGKKWHFKFVLNPKFADPQISRANL